MKEIGLDQKTVEKVVDILQALLSSEYVLYTKTLKFHWNVEGSHFGALHLFFKEQYEDLFKIVDDVAERIRVFDEDSFGTLEEFMEHAIIDEEPGENPEDLDMIHLLLEDHEAIISQLRKDIDKTQDDMGTNNFLCDLIEKHEKMAWMLRAHLE